MALTDPRDVARVESRTFISTDKQIDSVPTPTPGFNEPSFENNLDSMKCSRLGMFFYLPILVE